MSNLKHGFIFSVIVHVYSLVFDPYEKYMVLCNQLCLSSQPSVSSSVVQSKNLNVGHRTQTFQPNCFIPTKCIGTTDICHFIPLSVVLSMSEGL